MSPPRLDDRIYPKADQESEAQAFLEVYDVLQTLIKSKSLLIHLNDVKNALIPTNSTSNQTSEEILEKSITKQLYQQYKASKLLEFKEHFTQTESWRYFPAMYRSLRTRMPPQVNLNVLSNHPEIKAAVKKWNNDNLESLFDFRKKILNLKNMFLDMLKRTSRATFLPSQVTLSDLCGARYRPISNSTGLFSRHIRAVSNSIFFEKIEKWFFS